MDTDSILKIEPHEFEKFRCSKLDKGSIIDTIHKIINNHECFSTNYKYVPTKDQNYQNKINNKKFGYVNKFEGDQHTRSAFSLLNKISNENYDRLSAKLLKIIKEQNTAFTSLFAKELLKYCKKTELYTELLRQIVESSLCDSKGRDQFIDIFIEFVEEFKERVSFESIVDYIETFDYEDYDQFCEYKSQNMQKCNCLKAIISISAAVNKNDLILDVFNIIINAAFELLDVNAKYTYLFINESIDLAFLVLNASSSINELISNDIQQLQLLCIEIKETFQCTSKKLLFKVEDVLDKIQSNHQGSHSSSFSKPSFK